jgi:hypothetical protein
MVVVNSRNPYKSVNTHCDVPDGIRVGFGWDSNCSRCSTDSWNHGISRYAISSSQLGIHKPYSGYGNSQQHPVGPVRLVLRTVFLLALIVTSWTLARRKTGSEKIEVILLEDKYNLASQHVQHIIDKIRLIRNKILAEKKRLKEFSETHQLLDDSSYATDINNEIQNKEESKTSRSDSKRKIQKWINQRKTSLSDKIERLQAHLQTSHRRMVEEK